MLLFNGRSSGFLIPNFLPNKISESLDLSSLPPSQLPAMRFVHSSEVRHSLDGPFSFRLSPDSEEPNRWPGLISGLELGTS